MPSFVINDIAVKTLQDCTWSLQDLSSEDSGRTLDGIMHKDIVAQKRKLVCKWVQWHGKSAEVGFAGYDIDGSKMYWVSEDDFHMRDSVIENQLTIAQRLRFIPIETDTNFGIGIVAMV